MTRQSGSFICCVQAILLVVLTMLSPQAAHAEKRKFLVGNFEDVTIYGDMQVNIVTGKPPSSYVTGDRRMLDLLRLDRVSDHLIIRVQQPPHDDNGTRVTQPLVIYLSTRGLRNISIAGNAGLRVNGIDRDGISRILIDGGGSIDIDTLRTDKLTVSMAGNGRIGIGKGTARETDLRIRGAGIYDAQGLLTRKFMLEQEGNATVKARVEENATITNVGAGNISVSGNAECFIRKAGSAIITCPKDKKSALNRLPVPVTEKAK